MSAEAQRLWEAMRRLSSEREIEKLPQWEDVPAAPKQVLIDALADCAPVVRYERVPSFDRRIEAGDDFAGDAWVRWTCVGHRPEGAVCVCGGTGIVQRADQELGECPFCHPAAK